MWGCGVGCCQCGSLRRRVSCGGLLWVEHQDSVAGTWWCLVVASTARAFLFVWGVWVGNVAGVLLQVVVLTRCWVLRDRTRPCCWWGWVGCLWLSGAAACSSCLCSGGWGLAWSYVENCTVDASIFVAFLCF